MVSFKLENEFALTSNAVLVINMICSPAGRTPLVGSNRRPHPEIVLFKLATFEAVVLFWQIPWKELLGQFADKLLIFKSVDPILKLTISFSPSGDPQASTRILSISKH